MRTVEVKAPSFPDATPNQPMTLVRSKLWEVLCGDTGHWRAGFLSPKQTSAEECQELEQHTCPELFIPIYGRVCLVLAEKEGLKTVELELGKPLLVTAPHACFSPDGPNSGSVVVIERDSFTTTYRSPQEWLSLLAR